MCKHIRTPARDFDTHYIVKTTSMLTDHLVHWCDSKAEVYSILCDDETFGQNVMNVIEFNTGAGTSDDVTSEFAELWWKKDGRDFNPFDDEMPDFVARWANPGIEELKREWLEWEADARSRRSVSAGV